MTKPRIHTSLLFLCLLFLSTLQAQENTRIEVRADRNQILIGEPIQLSLSADIPENELIRFFRIDSIPHFEILHRGKIDTSNTGEGTLLRQIIRLTSFDSGSRVIPPLFLSEALQSDSIPVEVSYSAFNPEQPYHDIKDILEVETEEEKKRKWWWYIAGAAILLLLVVYFIFRKKKPAPPPPPPPPRDYFREAMAALDALRDKKLEGKAWFTDLVDIFRNYAEQRKGISSLQQTSEDLLSQLKQSGMPETRYSNLAQALRLSDFVKFAKYEPVEVDRNNSWQALRDAIQQLEEMN